MSGGHLVTGLTMAVTYVSGWVVGSTTWLSEAWAHITPGQAAVIIGGLTYLTHNGPKFIKWLSAKRAGGKGR